MSVEVYDLSDQAKLMHALFKVVPKLKFSQRRALAQAVLDSEWFTDRLIEAYENGWDQGHLGYDDGQTNPYRRG